MISDEQLGAFDQALETRAANPFLDSFNEPERARLEAEARRKQEAVNNLDSAILDWDNFSKGKPVDLRFNRDPEKAKKMGIIDSYLTIENGLEPIQGGSIASQMARDRIANERFNGIGVNDDNAFYGQIQKEAQTRKDRGVLLDELKESAWKSSIIATAEPDKDNPNTWEAFYQEAKKKPGYEPGLDPTLREAWTNSQEVLRERIEPFQDELAQVWGAMKKGGAGTLSEVLKEVPGAAGDEGKSVIDEAGKKDAAATAFSIYSSLPEESRADFMTALGMLSKTFPKEEQAGFFANLAKQGGRDVDALGRNALEAGINSALKAGMGSMPLTTVGPAGNLQGMTAEQNANVRKNYQAARNFASDVRRIEQQDFAAMKSAWGDDKPGTVEGGLYGVPGALASSVMAAASAPMIYLSMEGAAYDDLRTQLRASGLSDEKASEFADDWAPLSAVPQTVFEKLQGAAILGKLPFAEKAISRITDSIKNRVARYATRTAVGAIEETAIERAQDMINPAVQDIASALGQDVPGVNWRNGKDGVLDGFWTQSAQTLVTMLPLSIIGAAGGVSSEQRVKVFQEASDIQMLALGAKPEDVANFRTESAKGYDSGDKAIQQIYANLDPQSATAKAASEAQEAADLAKVEAAKALTDSGAFPVIRQNSEGWTVTDRATGTTYGPVPTSADAVRLASANFEAVQKANEDQVAYLASTLEAIEMANDKKSDWETDLGEQMTQAIYSASSPENAENLRKQVQLSEDSEENKDLVKVVFGSSSTVFQQNQRRTVNRLFKDASVATVFHETWHGLRREAQALGRITRQEEIEFVRGLDELFKKSVNKRGLKLQLLPDGIADEKITNTMLDEAISQVAEAEVLRSRKGGKGREGEGRKNIQNLPSGFITRNIKALTSAGMKSAKKFSAMFNAMRRYFGLAMGRAIIMRKAERDGTLNKENYDAFLSKMIGLTEQDSHDADASKVAQEITGDTSLSIGQEIIDPLISNAANKVKNPKAKERIFQEVISRLQKLNALVANRGVAFNFDAFGKPSNLEFSDEKTETLNALAILDGILAAVPPDLRGRVGGYTQLAKLDTNEKRLDYLKRRLTTVNRVIDDWLKKEYGKQFDKLLERAKPMKGKPGEKPKGKAGADVHALFNVLSQAREWNDTATEAYAQGLETEIASGNLSPEEVAHKTLEASLVRLVGDWKNADAARRASAVANATSVFEAGYATFKLNKLLQAEEREIRRESIKDDTGKQGSKAERDSKALADNGLKGGWKDNFLSLLSFEQLNEYLFGRESVEAERIVDMERVAAYQKEDSVQAKMDALDEVFTTLAEDSYKGTVLRYDLSQKSMEVAGESLSELESISATLMWQQEDGRRHMEGRKDGDGNFLHKGTGNDGKNWHYDQAFIDEIESKLSDDAKAVRSFISDAYSKEYAEINPVFKELNGINLPQNANYSPITVKQQQAQNGQTIDPVTGSTMSGSSNTPGSLKSRGSSISEPDFRDALQTYVAHTKQIQHYIAYAPFMQETAFLRNRELGNAIEAKGGEQALKVLRSWLDFFATGGTRDASAHLAMNKTMNKIASRAATSALIGRMGVLMIQSTQLGAAWAEMPTGAYLSRLGRLFTGNLGWGAAMKSDYIQRRIQQMPPVVQQAMEGLKSQKPNQLKRAVQAMGQLIGGADALFTAGTFAMVHDYQMQQAKDLGLSGAEAETYAQNAAERATERVAQPTRPGTRSLFENTAGGPALRVVWAFASEARQKLSMAMWRIADPSRSVGEKARAAAVTWVIGGVFASLIRSAWRDARDDDDEEVFDERNWSPKKLALLSLTGPLQGIPFLGAELESSIYSIGGEYQPGGNLLGSIPKAFKAATRVMAWGDAKPEEIMRDVDLILQGAALSNDTISAASSISHLIRDVWGVATNAVPE